MLGAFYLGGSALAFTPCCLPMMPILSGTDRRRTAAHGTARAVPAVAGLRARHGVDLHRRRRACRRGGRRKSRRPSSSRGSSAAFAALFVAMAPVDVRPVHGADALGAADAHRRSSAIGTPAGSLGGVAVMGALSALIVTTCVGPALVGALAVIGQTGRGRCAARPRCSRMSLGMGTPLLIVGASAGRLLPKAGRLDGHGEDGSSAR